ncbi:MAG: PAS domain S-box protein [Bdellovibrionota bacterium]
MPIISRSHRPTVTLDPWRKVVLENALDAVVGIDQNHTIIDWNHEAELTFGWTKAEAIGRKLQDLIIPPEYRQRHIQGMKRFLEENIGPLLNKRVEVPALHRNGKRIEIELAIIPISLESGHLFYSFIRDITERKNAERLLLEATQNLGVQYGVMTALVEELSLEEATPRILESIGKTLEWDIGTLWVVDPNLQTLRPFYTWNSNKVSAPLFLEATRNARLRKGEGLPGLVWQKGQPEWVQDISKDFVYPRGRVARSEGLHGGVGFPITASGKITGVIDFFSQRHFDRNESLLKTLLTLGGQIGLFMERKNAEERVRSSENRFRALFEQAPLSIQLLSPEGFTRGVNAGWKKLFCLPESFIADYIFREYNILEDPQLKAKGVASYLKRAFQGEFVKIPASLYDPSENGNPGRSRWIEALAYPVKNHKGEVIEVVLIHDDVTDRVLAERAVHESEERFRSLIQGVKDYAIFLLDRNGYVATWNEGAERLKAYKAEEIIGQHFSVFYPKEARGEGRPDQHLEIAARQGKYEEEGWRVCKFGNRFWASMVLTALYEESGALKGFSIINRDMSQRKKLEEDLREAVRARDEFLSIASHELKTPITSMKLQAEVQMRRLKRREPLATDVTHLERFISSVDKQVDRITRLVEDMLDISRLEHGKLPIEREYIDLVEVVQEVVERFSEPLRFAGCQCRVLFDGAVQGRWDRARIEQVVANLISNAIKYGAGTPIEVQVSLDETNARISVKDHGLGIANEDLERIFKRYERALSTGRISGLGLGLYISKQIVELHGGTIAVESELGKGSVFTVSLPFY